MLKIWLALAISVLALMALVPAVGADYQDGVCEGTVGPAGTPPAIEFEVGTGTVDAVVVDTVVEIIAVAPTTTQFLPGIVFDDDELVRVFQARALWDEMTPEGVHVFSFDQIVAAAGLRAATIVFDENQ